MLKICISRGPLAQSENQAVLQQYNEHTSSRIPMEEFLHWVQESPSGPAWHAMLRDCERSDEIVGHTCLIPMPASYRGEDLIAAKAEYSFVRASARTARVEGFETSARPKFIILTGELFRRCGDEGWGPFVISTTPALHPFGRSVGCSVASFPLTECLLILNPWMAARATPNLSTMQRIGMGVAGGLQWFPWRAATLALARGANGVGPVRARNASGGVDDARLTFFEDAASARWRYPDEEYAQIELQGGAGSWIRIKRGSAERYLRVCQYQLHSDRPSLALIARLVGNARAERALGVRWAVYGDDSRAKELVGRLRRFGFLCAPRVRRLLIHSDRADFQTSATWNLSDAMFSFDP